MISRFSSNSCEQKSSDQRIDQQIDQRSNITSAASIGTADREWKIIGGDLDAAEVEEDEEYQSSLAPAYYNYRWKLLQELRASGFDLHPHNFHADITIAEFCKKFDHMKDGERRPKTEVTVAGRVLAARDSSRKLFYYDLHGQGDKVQVVANFEEVNDKAAFLHQTHAISRGDVIGCRGYPLRMRRGELSIMARELTLLSPCMKLIPKIWHGLEDVDKRYRGRHVDLLVNEKSPKIFKTRAKIISTIRHFLEDREFLEVETPMMQSVPGGAVARPFVTHHNTFKTDLFLRISPELHLKRLVVGGLDRVFEIGKQFRNEGVDSTHNPEFTTLEMYMAYADYRDMQSLAEEMLSHVVKTVNGSFLVEFTPREATGCLGETEVIDFTPPFKRVNYLEELNKCANLDLRPDLLQEPATVEKLKASFVEHNIPLPDPATPIRLLDKLVQHFLEAKISDPCFIVDHPEISSPLAKPHRSVRGLCERFELIVRKNEILNAYSELNDPTLQREKFSAQVQERDRGDDEAMSIDEDYCGVLDYGLPPTAGLGLGIDRLTMLLTNSASIKEVVLFPVLRAMVDNNSKNPIISSTDSV